ncbi:hypothetical protein LEP1GSC137_0733 [Leptospira borgpetersenii str. Noumea 25]|uniref:Uncharacterized protein n=1 Tax=Leptospira borgpetersenii str. 200801926 TaxID=1193009 RepID=A0ABP2S174_LEPBO|nr:hypothetical protein LEP1GSC128_3140 [Leptospira borgpetersenii str. 200801926]EMO08931.1 hypothetical protein LEP1GSC137_0733 [Leptospira borgpetersenii str. Noumea 25]
MRLDPSDSKVLFNLWVRLCTFLGGGVNKLYFALYGSRNRWEDFGDFSLSENHTFCK